MPFNLFRRKKEPEPQQPAVATQEEPKQETEVAASEPAPQENATQEPTVPEQEQPTQEEPQQETTTVAAQEQPQETAPAPSEQKQENVAPLVEQKPAEIPSKTYLKAMPLRDISDLENIKNEVRNGNIIILKVTPLAAKSIEDVKNAVNDLYQFSEEIGGDIARLGEERVVICPRTVRIWREKTPAPVAGPVLPTTAA